jgi:hypothetical protein
MTPRRSRISRIYRHLTRRTPNRKTQWKQISQLRPHGSPGCPSTDIPRRACVPDGTDLWTEPPDNESTLEEWLPMPPAQAAEESDGRRGSGAIVAVLSTALFLLGCAYAAFAGYLLTVRATAAYVAVMASTASLAAAVIGITMASSPRRREQAGRFLGLSMISLVAVYGVLLAAVV